MPWQTKEEVLISELLIIFIRNHVILIIYMLGLIRKRYLRPVES
nr:MAG TPA: hypothetical protein [Caudoviricetes sp.]